ncbi:terminase large subunit [Cronobacter phage JC01]|uniref:Terminase, large subunit n=1 Tax=Cronobacter phage JC01 TaxID=2729575 RepID=A0A6M3YKC3_9CAUD|nr:terminase large subunit [Cronobacter phage JC01]QJI52230.1 terminase large subunit [Cronobacter phage JC01]
MTTKYKNLAAIVADLAEQLRPPERLTVAAAAEKYRFVNQPGAYIGPWLNETAPYMVEPMNVFASREYNRMAFVGPAQCGKTDSLIINGVAYSVKVDPLDTMVFCPTSNAARDFSMRRIDRLHMHSPEIGMMLRKSRDADNKFDKHYVNGMMLTLSFPSKTEMAGRPVGRIIMTDFDRMPMDVDGDGNPFDLASKRTTTFNSFAMCCAESSPSLPLTDPNWIAKGEHEAPPCEGIFALYNRGDRRRWQWPCLHCWTWFEGKFEHLQWDTREGLSNAERGETVRMVCPHCGVEIHPDERHEMQQWGMWVPEGCRVNEKGQLTGKRPRTQFASFWLRGTAAAFAQWRSLVTTYLDALDEYDRTMSEEALKKFWNNDMGEVYRPKSQESLRVPEALKARAEKLPEQMVPNGVRFLVATVDVQQNRFEVMVSGIMPGQPFDVVPIDRFKIAKSERLDVDGERLPINSSAYLEDWRLLEERVINASYPLADGSGRRMRVKITGCDSGGKAGTTDKAYDFWREQRDKGNAGRFILLKGEPNASAPRTRVGFPDSQRKDNKSAARGDIPVLFINSNMMKDSLNGRLDVMEPGKGMIHLATWMPDAFFSELCAEVRTDKGWQNPKNLRNEAWDLLYYQLALCASPKLLAVEMMDWENPVGWAEEWDKNDLVSQPDEGERFQMKASEDKIDFGKFAEALA